MSLFKHCAIVLASAGLMAGAVSACGNNATVDARDKGSAKLIINMPDGFPNVALKCLGTNGVYTSNNTGAGSGSPAVVLNDPQCGGR